MTQFNVTKRWEIKGEPYKAYVSPLRGVTYTQAEMILEDAFAIESCKMMQDIEPIDYNQSVFPQFTVTNNEVKFTYAIEEDYIFQQMAEALCPSNQNFKLN